MPTHELSDPTSVADPHQFEANPDPACHFDADPDTDPTFNFDAERLKILKVLKEGLIPHILAFYLKIDADPDLAFHFRPNLLCCGSGT